MKKIFIIYLVVLSSVGVKAQTAYLGGEGDGHAMASLKFDNVNSVATNSQEISVYPSILGNNQYLFVNAIQDVKSVFLVDMKGNKFLLEGNNQFLIAQTMHSGLYTLIIEKDSKLFYSKIVIIEG